MCNEDESRDGGREAGAGKLQAKRARFTRSILDVRPPAQRQRLYVDRGDGGVTDFLHGGVHNFGIALQRAEERAGFAEEASGLRNGGGATLADKPALGGSGDR